MKFTEIARAVYIFIAFLWIFPAIRQYRNKFFYFFLILAIADTVSAISTSLLDYNIHISIYLLYSYLMLISLQSKEIIMKRYEIIAAVLILIIASQFINFPVDLYNGGIILILILIFFDFFIMFVKTNVEEKAVNIFIIVLMFYILTNILKFTNLFFGLSNAVAYFYLTTFFQILIGLYFSIFNADSPRNLIKINI